MTLKTMIPAALFAILALAIPTDATASHNPPATECEKLVTGNNYARMDEDLTVRSCGPAGTANFFQESGRPTDQPWLANVWSVESSPPGSRSGYVAARAGFAECVATLPHRFACLDRSVVGAPTTLLTTRFAHCGIYDRNKNEIATSLDHDLRYTFIDHDASWADMTVACYDSSSSVAPNVTVGREPEYGELWLLGTGFRYTPQPGHVGRDWFEINVITDGGVYITLPVVVNVRGGLSCEANRSTVRRGELETLFLSCSHRNRIHGEKVTAQLTTSQGLGRTDHGLISGDDGWTWDKSLPSIGNLNTASTDPAIMTETSDYYFNYRSDNDYLGTDELWADAADEHGHRVSALEIPITVIEAPAICDGGTLHLASYAYDASDDEVTITAQFAPQCHLRDGVPALGPMVIGSKFIPERQDALVTYDEVADNINYRLVLSLAEFVALGQSATDNLTWFATNNGGPATKVVSRIELNPGCLPQDPSVCLGGEAF